MTRNTETLDQALGYRWITVSMWLFASLSGLMPVDTMGIRLPAIRSDLHLVLSQQRTLVSTSFWAPLTMAVHMSWWTTRLGSKILTMSTLGLLAHPTHGAIQSAGYHAPMEVAVALALTMMMISFGTVLGSLVAGFLQEALGNLRLTLLIISFIPLSLSVAGRLLQIGRKRTAT